MATKKTKSAATTKKAAPKAAKTAKKTVKKSSPEFERAVRTATWCTVGFAIMEMVWSTLGYGYDLIVLILLAVMGTMAVLIKRAHNQKNNGLIMALTSGLTLLLSYIMIQNFVINSALILSPSFCGGIFSKLNL